MYFINTNIEQMTHCQISPLYQLGYCHNSKQSMYVGMYVCVSDASTVCALKMYIHKKFRGGNLIL